MSYEVIVRRQCAAPVPRPPPLVSARPNLAANAGGYAYSPLVLASLTLCATARGGHRAHTGFLHVRVKVYGGGVPDGFACWGSC